MIGEALKKLDRRLDANYVDGIWIQHPSMEFMRRLIDQDDSFEDPTDVGRLLEREKRMKKKLLWDIEEMGWSWERGKTSDETFSIRATTDSIEFEITKDAPGELKEKAIKFCSEYGEYSMKIEASAR